MMEPQRRPHRPARPVTGLVPFFAPCGPFWAGSCVSCCFVFGPCSSHNTTTTQWASPHYRPPVMSRGMRDSHSLNKLVLPFQTRWWFSFHPSLFILTAFYSIAVIFPSSLFIFFSSPGYISLGTLPGFISLFSFSGSLGIDHDEQCSFSPLYISFLFFAFFFLFPIPFTKPPGVEVILDRLPQNAVFHQPIVPGTARLGRLGSTSTKRGAIHPEEVLQG